MTDFSRQTRRSFLRQSASLAGLCGAAISLPLPLWAVSRNDTATASGTRSRYDLTIGPTPISVDGRTAPALGINGSVPGPLLRFREGDSVTLNVKNALDESSSLHWHGLLLPTDMDGVPGVSFDGIGPQQTYRYAFDVRQNGTYWYHSHSGLQEQSGVYGPIIIDPAGPDPVQYDREYIVLLSDWTFEDPNKVFANLKKSSERYAARRLETGDEIEDRSMWSRMRMSPTAIADISGITYSFLLNGQDSLANWTGIFHPGEKIRLRIINGSAMTFFNVRIPDLAMTVVQADGQNIDPVSVEEFQIGTAVHVDGRGIRSQRICTWHFGPSSRHDCCSPGTARAAAANDGGYGHVACVDGAWLDVRSLNDAGPPRSRDGSWCGKYCGNAGQPAGRTRCRPGKRRAQNAQLHRPEEP
jgi:CopA family copper-resistance protein